MRLLALCASLATAMAPALGEPPASAPAPAAATLWWCTHVATNDGDSFESQCFADYGACLDYRGQLMSHDALTISPCRSQPRAWVMQLPGARGARGEALYEARETKRECAAYRRALRAVPGARHLRITGCRARRPSQVTGRNSATLRMQRAAGSAARDLTAP